MDPQNLVNIYDKILWIHKNFEVECVVFFVDPQNLDTIDFIFLWIQNFVHTYVIFLWIQKNGIDNSVFFENQNNNS